MSHFHPLFFKPENYPFGILGLLAGSAAAEKSFAQKMGASI
jgi:hypothetical protein